MLYFKFKNSEKNIVDEENSFFYTILGKFLKVIIPKSNPIHNNLFDDVNVWLIEYDEINKYTNREIGLDLDNNVIVKSPYKENLGLWTDEDLSFDDYKKFHISYTTKIEFEKLWKLYPLRKDSVLKTKCFSIFL